MGDNPGTVGTGLGSEPTIEEQIAAYQRDHNTQPTGVLDPATLQGLSVYTR